MHCLKSAVLLTSILVSGLFSKVALANSEQSNWTGKGVLYEEDSTASVPITMAITANISASKFSFKDCWDNPSQQVHGCISSEYDLDSDSNILSNGKKIGDVFPGHIVLFIGNDQVSEQIVIDFDEATLGAAKNLHYQYTFVSFDGINLVRRGDLLQKH